MASSRKRRRRPSTISNLRPAWARISKKRRVKEDTWNKFYTQHSFEPADISSSVRGERFQKIKGWFGFKSSKPPPSSCFWLYRFATGFAIPFFGGIDIAFLHQSLHHFRYKYAKRNMKHFSILSNTSSYLVRSQPHKVECGDSILAVLRWLLLKDLAHGRIIEAIPTPT